MTLEHATQGRESRTTYRDLDLPSRRDGDSVGRHAVSPALGDVEFISYESTLRAILRNISEIEGKEERKVSAQAVRAYICLTLAD